MRTKRAVTFKQALAKGHPEFDEDQPRGEDGRWASTTGVGRKTMTFTDEEDGTPWEQVFDVHANANFKRPVGSVKAYHTTPIGNVASILREGLRMDEAVGSRWRPPGVWHWSERSFGRAPPGWFDEHAVVVSRIPKNEIFERTQGAIVSADIRPEWIEQVLVPKER